MNKSRAIQQSLIRLEKTREALARLESAKSFKETESAWADLLIQGNGIYSKLEQGSKASGKASSWYGRIKNLRKVDALLSYMHHARNAEEHGIEETTKRFEAGQATLTIREPFDPVKLNGIQIFINTDNAGHIYASSSNEDLITTKTYREPSIALIRVKDMRFGDYFDPPYEHLGQNFTDQSPLAVGRLFVAYLAGLIDEAIVFGV